MLTVRILCVGKMKEKFYAAACAEYRKRLTGKVCLDVGKTTGLDDRHVHAHQDTGVNTKEEQQIAQHKVSDTCPRARAKEHNGHRDGGVDEIKDIAIARQAHTPLKQRGRGEDNDGAEHRG